MRKLKEEEKKYSIHANEIRLLETKEITKRFRKYDHSIFSIANILNKNISKEKSRQDKNELVGKTIEKINSIMDSVILEYEMYLEDKNFNKGQILSLSGSDLIYYYEIVKLYDNMRKNTAIVYNVQSILELKESKRTIDLLDKDVETSKQKALDIAYIAFFSVFYMFQTDALIFKDYRLVVKDMEPIVALLQDIYETRNKIVPEKKLPIPTMKTFLK